MWYQIQGYGLEVVREPADGPVVSVLVHHAAYGAEPASWSDSDLTRILREAREMDGDRDPRSEAMPSDDSLLRACLADLCMEVGGEAAAPLLQRLGEAHDGLSDMAGIVVSHECVEAVSDAYDTLQDALAALRVAYAVIDSMHAHDDVCGALNRAGLAGYAADAHAKARAAIAKVGG